MSDPAELVKLLRAEGRKVTMTEPGEITVDVDGIPDGINPPQHTAGTLANIYLSAEQWESVARYLINKQGENK